MKSHFKHTQKNLKVLPFHSLPQNTNVNLQNILVSPNPYFSLEKALSEKFCPARCINLSVRLLWSRGWPFLWAGKPDMEHVNVNQLLSSNSRLVCSHLQISSALVLLWGAGWPVVALSQSYCFISPCTTHQGCNENWLLLFSVPSLSRCLLCI